MTSLQDLAREVAAKWFSDPATGITEQTLAAHILTALEAAVGESKKATLADAPFEDAIVVHSKDEIITDLRAQLTNREIDLRSETDFASNLSKEIDQLKSQLEQARKDGERLDWLDHCHSSQFWQIEKAFDLCRSLRTAIDTTRQAEKEQG